MLKGLKAMISRMRNVQPVSKPDPLSASLTTAIQANERASVEAREALREMLDRGKMRESITGIVGKMQ